MVVSDPWRCRVTPGTLNKYTVKEFFCHQRVTRVVDVKKEDGSSTQVNAGLNQELVEKRVYYLSSEEPSPSNYLATGWIKTHPKTQQVTFLIETLIPQEDDFQSFRTAEHLDELHAFQKLSWKEKITDISENITKVYERDDLLTGILLTYFSSLEFEFGGELINGWINCAVLGDSGSGKTQTCSRISEYIGVGDFLSGLTSTRTGLAYALVEHKQKGWQVKIGRYPANSRKLLVVDETQHLPEWDMRAISIAMEKGFLQIDRVKSKGYEAKTRLILIANPIRDKVMDTYSFGCQALGALLKVPVVRRLDFAVFANSSDVQDISRINAIRSDKVPKQITQGMLRSAVYWIWNLTPERITFTSEAEAVCLAQAEKLSGKYGYAVDVPLAKKEDLRKKLARIAAAFAGIFLSSDPGFERLIIKEKHAELAARFLDQIYSQNNCALNEYSDVMRSESQLPDYPNIRDVFIKKLENSKHGSSDNVAFVRAMAVLRVNERIPREDLAEQVGVSTKTISRIINILRRFNLIGSSKQGYLKKPKFLRFLKRFREEPEGQKFFENAFEGDFDLELEEFEP